MSLLPFTRNLKINFMNNKNELIVDQQLISTYLSDDYKQFIFKDKPLEKEQEYLDNVEKTVDITNLNLNVQNIVSLSELTDNNEDADDLNGLLIDNNFTCTRLEDGGLHKSYYKLVTTCIEMDDSNDADFSLGKFKFNY